MAATRPYGTWQSPISAALVAEAGVRLGEIHVDGSDVYWLEARPSEGGRQVVVRRTADGEIADIAPPDANARTRVHEYGGGSFAVHEGTVWFVDFRDQQIHRVHGAGEPQAITRGDTSRFADLVVSPDGRWVVCVRETHPGGGPSEVVNDLVAVPSDGGEPVVLTSGRDFYATPRLSPDGARLAWLEWDHPNMPWDGTELLVAPFEDGRVGKPDSHHGAQDESLFQPEWSPDGVLHVISDRSGWWNIHRVANGDLEPLHELEAEVGFPQWLFGFRRYGFLDDGRVVFAAFDAGGDRLGVLDGTETRWIDVPHRSMGYHLRTAGSRVLYVGSSPTEPSGVVEVDPDTGATQILRRSAERPVDESFLAVPEHVTFPTEGREVAHALLYRPTNPDFRGPDDERPPLLVESHGGPTSHTLPAFLLSIQYWTSRGCAVADVNYRGSTGYGREFRRKLDGTWGIVDLEDCTAVATWLADQGEVDPDRLLVSGGSAGGYTTLCALTFREVFAAGASHYGVADIEALVRETHKFESRYIDRLVGPWPEAADVYAQRSPIHHTDRLATPMIVLQGLEDEVVPPSQAEAMVAALDAKQVPHAYVTFPDEQHGFRRAENQIRALESELAFYGAVLGFEPADDLPDLDIRHL
ncbi:MAG: S9 family peptidase [Nitriliruptorales bacterium]